MIIEPPYFLSNNDWYTYNYDKYRYELTNKATQKAIESYNDFYKLVENEVGGN